MNCTWHADEAKRQAEPTVQNPKPAFPERPPKFNCQVCAEKKKHQESGNKEERSPENPMLD